MLHQPELERLVDMQHRSYILLKWMAKAVSEGFVSFQTAQDYATLPEAAEGWILGHYLNIPDDARPPREDLPAFCAIFSTYLTNSFDLPGNPGKRFSSPNANCYSPKWLIDAPNLQAKRLSATDKRRAQAMRIKVMMNLAVQHGLGVREVRVEGFLDDRHVFEDASLVAYGYDLLQREKGIANGPSVLALWRGFAWNKSGSPKHGFRLKAKLIADAENRLLALLQDIGQNAMTANVAEPSDARETSAQSNVKPKSTPRSP